jgi:hypothetical protein
VSAAIFLYILLSIAAAELARAADSSSKHTLEDLAWISGSWRGVEGDTRIEEHWSESTGGSMMGSFKMVKSDEAVFYEFMLIEQSASGPVLRIKHFSPGLDGWETKDESVDLDLVEAGPDRAIFETVRDGNTERIIYSKTAAGGLIITLEKPAKDSTTEFRFERQ